MTHCYALRHQTTRRIPRLARVAALGVAFTVSVSQSAYADRVMPPPVPSNISVAAGNKAFFEGHAIGTQDYVCLPSGAGFAWTFFGPQATLFGDPDKQVATHFLSPNPSESGTPRATWQDSKDTSTVWAVAIASSSDSAFVAPNAIPWLLLQVVGSQEGPTGGDKLSDATFIHRLHTSGGIAPATGCVASTDVGKKAFVPYTADYFFYR